MAGLKFCTIGRNSPRSKIATCGCHSTVYKRTRAAR